MKWIVLAIIVSMLPTVTDLLVDAQFDHPLVEGFQP